MHWPQWTYVIIVLLGLGVELERHGKPKRGMYSFWTTATGNAIGFALLAAGGFFG